ncbi:hypothetical protein KC356_g15 [Hortaea werneckii]|nr:hypothetical protein KC356_g15 [Hortaea werneckii]
MSRSDNQLQEVRKVKRRHRDRNIHQGNLQTSSCGSLRPSNSEHRRDQSMVESKQHVSMASVTECLMNGQIVRSMLKVIMVFSAWNVSSRFLRRRVPLIRPDKLSIHV